jgi:putative ABC transport system permease protein
MSPLKYNSPPTARWLLRKAIPHAYLEEFLGDLDEVYQERIETMGVAYAKLMYWLDAFHLMLGFSSRRQFKLKYQHSMLFKSTVKIAWRHALRQKQFTFLNVVGLTLGIATTITIGLYVHDELTHDTFHTHADRIYRVNQPLIWGNWDEQFSSTGPNVAIALREEVHEFEQVTRIYAPGEQTVNAPRPDKELHPITERRFYSVDSNFFDVFTFAFLKGEAAAAIKEPQSMVITETTAKRYFGSIDVLGKTIDVKQTDGTWQSFKITGVLADIPPRSHLQFDFLVSSSSYQTFLQQHEWKWIFSAFSTYVLVKEDTDIDFITKKIQSIPPKWAAATTEKIFNKSFEEYTKGKPWRLYLQPLREIYFSGEPSYHRFGPTGHPQFARLFGGVGVLVLLLCCINFMNLSTARSAHRAKEVGIKKVMGSLKQSLVRQFVVESFLYVFASTLCACLIVQLFLPGFNNIAEKHIELIPYLLDSKFLAGLVAFVLALSLLAGSYPAFYLSAFTPIETLKGKISNGFKGKNLRNTLVVFQFTMSITLIICTVFVQKQLSYTSSLDLGFSNDNILQIHNIEQLGTKGEVLKTKLKTNPVFTHVGKSYGLPPYIREGEQYKAFGPNTEIIEINNLRATEDYIALLDLEFVAGRNFDPQRVNDKHTVILNEAAVKALGWGARESYAHDSPIGKYVVQAFDQEHELEVIGVVQDFNYHDLKEKINPLMIVHPENDWFWNYGQGPSYISVRLDASAIQGREDIQSVIESVKKELSILDNTIPFDYSFMDEGFNDAFSTETRMATVLNIFTFMALTIACLGLFGLSAFSAERRLKELGIRKVLGASVSELILLFSTEFTRLIIIAIAIASPLAYFLVDAWLTDFVYRTPITFIVFLTVIAATFGVALLTISYQSVVAANNNPVNTLKNE